MDERHQFKYSLSDIPKILAAIDTSLKLFALILIFSGVATILGIQNKGCKGPYLLIPLLISFGTTLGVGLLAWNRRYSLLPLEEEDSEGNKLLICWRCGNYRKKSWNNCVWCGQKFRSAKPQKLWWRDYFIIWSVLTIPLIFLFMTFGVIVYSDDPHFSLGNFGEIWWDMLLRVSAHIWDVIILIFSSL